MSTLANARDVLRLIAQRQKALSVTEVAVALDQPKSSTSRTLSMMAEFGFLERDPETLAYRPGVLIAEASRPFQVSGGTGELVEQELRELVKHTGHTGYVSVLDGGEVLVLHMRIGTISTLQAYTPAGTRGPAYATSLGRVLLARISDAEVMRIVDDHLDGTRGNGPTSPDELLKRLEQIRRVGWDASSDEYVPNVAGVSASVQDSNSGRIFGLGLALPSTQFVSPDVDELGKLVRNAALRVGENIGDTYWAGLSASGDLSPAQRNGSKH